MIKQYITLFDSFEEDPKSTVFEVFPQIFSDKRGSFSEVIKDCTRVLHENYPLWFTSLDWIKQINRSKSVDGTIRGMHAQKGKFCQGKFVESITDVIYDIIIDARPNSKTFGVAEIFILDPVLQNKLWVPRGFLHGFAVPKCKDEAIFTYYCDNTYDKSSEFGISPSTCLPEIVKLHKDGNHLQCFESLYLLFDDESKIVFSDKDISGHDYNTWMSDIKHEFEETGKLWYKN